MNKVDLWHKYHKLSKDIERHEIDAKIAKEFRAAVIEELAEMFNEPSAGHTDTYYLDRVVFETGIEVIKKRISAPEIL